MFTGFSAPLRLLCSERPPRTAKELKKNGVPPGFCQRYGLERRFEKKKHPINLKGQMGFLTEMYKAWGKHESFSTRLDFLTFLRPPVCIFCMNAPRHWLVRHAGERKEMTPKTSFRKPLLSCWIRHKELNRLKLDNIDTLKTLRVFFCCCLTGN